MATRQESAERTRALVVELCARIRRGELPAGSRIPSLPDLGRRHGLSKPTVLGALQPLIADGTLEVRPRVGIFVADATRVSGVHVIVTSREQTQALRVRTAFAERLEELGAETLALDAGDIASANEFTELVGTRAVLGVFVFAPESADAVISSLDAVVPIVVFNGAGTSSAHRGRVSYVDLDNADIGQRAARELLFAGHRHVAFLGMHADDRPSYHWSAQRWDGCAAALRRHQPRTPMIQMLAPTGVGRLGYGDSETSTAIRTQVAMLAVDRRDEYSACVTADDRMITALSSELHARGVPESEWPVMVGVEGLPTGTASHVASVLPGWSDLGAQAGQLLFDSSTGQRPIAGQLDLVPATGLSRP